MGACASTVKEWKHEAEHDEEVTGKPQGVPSDLPASYFPAVNDAAPQLAAAAPTLPHRYAKAAGIGADSAMHKVPSQQWFFRKSQEESVAHLVRHPRLQPFAQLGGRFGLEPAYQPIRLLGRGGTGQTWLCREAATGNEYAVKLQQRPIPRGTVRLTYNEITIQASTCVSSVHMSHIREVALTPSHLALVLVYEPGGSAAEFVAEQIPKVSRLDLVVDEDFARFCFKQLILGLEHLHENHIAHRDVKLDNTLMDGSHPPKIMLCDFQFAKYWGKPQLARMKSHLGTAVYMSPELIENRHTHSSYDPVEVDVWAAGVWLVALLVGAFPFDNRPGADDTAAEIQILHQEMSGNWTDSKFVRPYIRQLSPEAIDLLNHILHINPEQRIGLEGIAVHPWMQKPLPPHLEAAWQRIRHEQLQLERHLATLAPDHDLVHQRNSRIFDLVREAAVPPEQWEQSYQRLSQVCRSLPLIDCSSVPHVVRIDTRPEAVARRLSDRALAMLDATPPGTPQRFSMPPIPTIDSSTSLANMMPGSGQPAALAPLPSSATGTSSDAEGLRKLSPFAMAQPAMAHSSTVAW